MMIIHNLTKLKPLNYFMFKYYFDYHRATWAIILLKIKQDILFFIIMTKAR